jgi:hypothetical protein
MLTDQSQIVPFTPNAVPEQLKSLIRWVLWKALPDAKKPGTLSKVPYDGRFTDTKASHSDPATWTSFDTCLRAYEDRADTGADGLMVAAGDGLVGIDLDDAIDPTTDQPTPEAQRIIDLVNSYTERSVSNTGIRILAWADEQKSFRYKGVEVYFRQRFLTVTGRHVAGTPLTIERRDAEVESLRGEVEARRHSDRPRTSAPSRPAVHQPRGVTALGISNDEVIRTASETCPGFEDFWSGDWEWASEDRSAADMKFIGQLAFYCGPGEEERVFDLAMASGMVREKWLDRPGYLTELTIPRAYEDREDYYTWEPQLGTLGRYRPAAIAEATNTAVAPQENTCVVDVAEDLSPDAQPASGETPVGDGDPRPTVVLGPETDAILLELEEYLSSKLYQRDGELISVHYVDGADRGQAIRRAGAARVLRAVSKEEVQRLMSREIRFVKAMTRGRGKKKRKVFEQVPAPADLARLFCNCGRWQRIPHLVGVTTTPFMRPDGTVVTTPGYDAESGYLFLQDGTRWEPVPEAPTRDEVRAAVELLDEVIVDFPFVGPHHRAAWVAQLLTAVARQAIVGPVPMLVVDGNQKGTGKSKLGRIIGRILLGFEATEISFTSDEKEMENRLASALGAGDRFAVFDNCTGTIRNPILDKFLTSSRFDFRRFFAQDMAKLVNNITLALTGNNLTLRGDLSRRILRVRLVTQEERPEARTNFRHADLEQFIDINRPRIFTAALTILKAHAAAGFARCCVRAVVQDGTVVETQARSVGSYGEWDRVVRHAVLRAGYVDPIATQDEAREEDEDDVKLLAVLQAWYDFDPRMEVTATALITRVFGDDGREQTNDHRVQTLREAILELTGTGVGRCPDPKQLGYRFRDARDKKVSGYKLTRIDGRTKAGLRYAVRVEAHIAEARRLCPPSARDGGQPDLPLGDADASGA